MVSDQERYEALAMAAVDGMLTANEREELARLVADHPQRAAELADFNAFKAETDAMRDRIAASAQLEPIRPSTATQKTLNLGFLLIWLGILGLYGLGAYQFMVDPTVSLPMKVAGGLFGTGLALLFAIALRTRLRSLENDPYSEIDR